MRNQRRVNLDIKGSIECQEEILGLLNSGYWYPNKSKVTNLLARALPDSLKRIGPHFINYNTISYVWYFKSPHPKISLREIVQLTYLIRNRDQVSLESIIKRFVENNTVLNAEYALYLLAK
jgi:hypothetical protein